MALSGGWSIWDTDLDERHLVPNDDARPHSHTDKCWCEPTLNEGLFVHHPADRREHTVEQQ